MKYVSKKSELCLVMRPTDRIIDEQRRVKMIPGKRVEFYAGQYQTDDPEVVEWLHNHPKRGTAFAEITEHDEKLVEVAKSTVPKISTGMVTTTNVVDSQIEAMINADLGKIEVPTRPVDTALISPELIKIIDERINAAMGTIIDLLKKDDVKEEKVLSGKPTKSFTCPYCGESFSSGFKVGDHKKVCDKRPKQE